MDEINVKAEPFSIEQLNQLEHDWKTLFAKSEQCFFLSWNWIGSWLSILPPQSRPTVVRAKVNNKIIGLAIFCHSHVRRHGFVTSLQMHMHRAGIAELDQMWIEYNDVLCAKDYVLSTRDAIFKYVISHFDFDELSVPMATSAGLSAKSSKSYSSYWLNSTSHPAFKINLSKPYKPSKNLHRQITKTDTLLTSWGELSWSITSNKEEIFKILNLGKHWHQEKWRNTLTPSGFDNAVFESFHHRLIDKNDNENKVVIVALSHQNRLIGFNYLLADKHSVYFYLSSLMPVNDNRIKIGYLLHSKCIEWATEQNYRYYDFLAGESSYKQRFSDEKYCLFDNILQKKKLSFYAERILSTIKHKVVRD